MIAKTAIFVEVFRILKEASKPVSQGHIVQQLVALGYKRTTIQALFKPSLLQPVFVKQGSEEYDYTEPLVKKLFLPSETRAHFVLNEKWNKVGEADVQGKLFGLD